MSDFMNLLEIENLSISFEQYVKGMRKRIINVVHDLNITVKEGEILAIFGASGSGKSLLAHSILGLLPYNAKVSGNYVFKGKSYNYSQLCTLRGREISLVPQSITSLNPLLKTKKQINLGLNSYEKAKADKIFKDFGLSEKVYDLYPHELSGGMARRVLVSSAIVKDVSLIVADEPTPGMDDDSLEEITKMFKALRDQGKSLLLITHDIDMATALADRIGIFYDGTIIEVEEACKFKGQGLELKHPYSKALLRALPKNGFLGPDEDIKKCLK